MLKELLGDSVNRVEIYLTPKEKSLELNGIYQVHQLGWTCDKLPYKLKVFGSPFETTTYELINEDITYIYDLATDGQKAIRKVWKTDIVDKHLYGIGFQEELLPSHRFPCSKDIAIAQTIERKQYRINNRIQLIVEKSQNYPTVVYISYYHSPNVDMDKMERDMNYFFKKIKQVGLYPIN